MKPIIFLNLLLLSTTLYANTQHCDARNSMAGSLDITTQDITISYGSQPKVPVSYALKFWHPDTWSNFFLFTILVNNDVEGIQNQIKWDRWSNTAGMCIFTEEKKFESPILKMLLPVGKHTALVEMHIPEYGCQVIATSTITVTP